MNYMKKLFLFLIFFPILSASAWGQDVMRINVNKLCADYAKIPYRSDGFSDKDYAKFLQCVNHVKHYKE